MHRKAGSGIMLSLLLIGMLTLAFNIQPVKASETIYIRADGSVDPSTAPISSVDNITYTFTDNIYDGIIVERSNTIVDGNGYTLQGYKSGYGFNLTGINNVTIKNINIKGFNCGVYLNSTYHNVLSRNNITANEKSGIWLLFSYNSSISGNNIASENEIAYGIRFYGSSNNDISGNTIASNYVGILFSDSSNNSIVENMIASNFGGMHLYESSNYNSVSGNNITANNLFGAWLSEYSNYNRISGNDVTANKWGVVLRDSSDSSIYHNNFVNNTNQVYIYNSTNVWDDGYPSGGNYWSDYNGTDTHSGPYQNVTGSDGIGDTPYIINGTNQDNYPLIHPYGSICNLDTNLTYFTIQSAINAPETLNGHKIFVEAGTYYENVVVNKSLSLVGKNKENTIIDAGRIGTVVIITADHVTVSGLTIRNSGIEYYAGIYLSVVNYCNIANNSIANNLAGILLYYSSNNRISGNNITENNGNGISLYLGSSNNTVSGNNIINNGCGIWHGYSSYNTLYGNNIKNNHDGILLDFSNRSTISNNIILNNYFGILLSGSSENSISGNAISSSYVGIFLEYTHLNESTGNTIIGNTISNNEYGIGIEECGGNTIYHNNFITNTIQAGVSPLHTNIWDNGYPSGGNYWSDYTGVDVKNGPGQDKPGSDGIGDTPYTIDANNRDNYPFMNPWGAPPPPLYTLSIFSSPTGVTFTVDGVSCMTPWSGTYSEGASLSLVMPEIYAVGETKYYWNQWSDGNTSRSRRVTMNTNITLTAYFTGPYYELTVTSSPITGITFTIDEVPETTPYTEWLPEGSYTLEMPETHDGYVWSHWFEDEDTNRTKAITLPGTTWTGVYKPAPPPPAVGGKMILIKADKPPPLTPTGVYALISVISAIIFTTASVAYVKHRKKKQT